MIVGAGPAGTAAAWRLSSRGKRCILIDKAVFPREKVCGGVLSGRAADLLTGSGMMTEEQLDDLTLARHSSLSLWDRGERLRTFTSSGSSVSIISRLRLDSVLLERAASAGAEVITSEEVIEITASSVRTASGREFRFLHLVGADGCNSTVRRLLFGRAGRRSGFGLECLVPLSGAGAYSGELEIHFGYIPYGYIWLFPDSKKVCIGAGAVGSPVSAAGVRSALTDFLASRGIDSDAFPIVGAPIPSLAVHRSMGADNVYLIGDAAGLVDQVSGEGIGFAVESGFIAADAIAGLYTRRSMIRQANRGCMGMVKQSVFYRHLLFGSLFRDTAMNKLRENETFASGYWDIVSGGKSYNEMFRDLLIR